MSNLSVAGQPVQDRYLSRSESSEQPAANVNGSAAQPYHKAKEFSALASQPGVITALLNGQSVMLSDSGAKPALAEPAKGVEKLHAEQASALVKMSADLQAPSDAGKLEGVAASAATLLASHIPTPKINSKGSESSTPSREVTSAGALSAGGALTRSQPAIEAGTDITAVESTGSRFINVMGDMRLIEVMNTVNVTLNQAEATAAQSSARATARMVNAAERAGTKTIEAAQQRMNGAITAGVMGVTAQGATTARSLKALGKESKSITQNLGKAHDLEHGLRTNQNAIKQSADTMLQRGSPLDRNVESAMSGHDAKSVLNSESLRRNHSTVQNNTQSIRHQSEFGNQAIHSTQGIVNNSYDVAAASQTREAELARADQSVNSEVSGAHQQAAKKAGETRTALTQALEAALNTNNSTASSISERMR
ncbi:type III secretion system protein [Erwinia sp. E602]|uniref:type III secretion system protein n=1 Tax=Erwinia sp. E602 TaxID=2675378 RepID=UPI001BAB3C38|nr:type III secretion system protein [Erwinia sp. E602]QUG74595.1 type III secretion system protein [Erwinia sp. E602]